VIEIWDFDNRKELCHDPKKSLNGWLLLGRQLIGVVQEIIFDTIECAGNSHAEVWLPSSEIHDDILFCNVQT
jgi:hypothetical protein